MEIDWTVLDRYHDYFTPTYELCGEPVEYRPFDDLWITGDEVYADVQALVSDDCYDAIGQDMQLVEDSFPLDDYVEIYGDVETAQSVKEGYIARAKRAGYALMAMGLGTIDDLDRLEDDLDLFYVRPDVIDMWQELGERVGEDRLQALAYNYVMTALTEVTFANEREVDWQGRVVPETGAAILTFEDAPAINGNVLVHEATHVWQPSWHVQCAADSFWGANANCDETWLGPWGIAASVSQLQRGSLLWEDEPEWSENTNSSIGAVLKYSEWAILEECCPEMLEDDDTGAPAEEAGPEPLAPASCGTKADTPHPTLQR